MLAPLSDKVLSECRNDWPVPVPLSEIAEWANEVQLFNTVISDSDIYSFCVDGVENSSGEHYLPCIEQEGELFVSRRALVSFKKSSNIGNRIFEPEPYQYSDPTTAIPGSAEKIEVLRSRFLAGLHLFHPNDEVSNSVAPSSGSGQRIDQATFDRARKLYQSGASVPEISDRLLVSRSWVKAQIADGTRKTNVTVEPWLLYDERRLLELMESGLTLARAQSLVKRFSLARLSSKLGIERHDRESLLLGWEEYQQRQRSIERSEQEAREAKKEREQPDFSTPMVIDRRNPIDWTNIEIHNAYRLARNATFRLRFHADRDDIVQELVILAPRIVREFGGREGDVENYVFKAFIKKSISLMRSAGYRSPFVASKSKDRPIVASLDSTLESQSSVIATRNPTPCINCATPTTRRNMLCSNSCASSLHHYRSALTELSNNVLKVLDRTADGRPVTKQELIQALEIDEKATTLPIVMAWIHALGFVIKLTAEGYIVSGLSKLDRELWLMATPNYSDPQIVSRLQLAGVRIVRQKEGWVARGELSIAQQIMLYRIRPWKTDCQICGVDMTPEAQESLTGRYYVSTTCSVECRSKLNGLRNRKGWLI